MGNIIGNGVLVHQSQLNIPNHHHKALGIEHQFIIHLVVDNQLVGAPHRLVSQDVDNRGIIHIRQIDVVEQVVGHVGGQLEVHGVASGSGVFLRIHKHPVLALGDNDLVQAGIAGLVLALRAMGSFQGSQTGDRSQAGVFSEFVEQYNVVALFRLGVGLPPGVGGIVIPAVDHLVAVIQDPVGANFAEDDSRCSVAKNIIASRIGMVVVNHRVGGQGQIGAGTGVIHAAAIAGGALVVDVVHNGQLCAFLEDNFAVVGQAAAIVAGDGDHSPRLNQATSNATGQFQASIVASPRILGHGHRGGGIYQERSSCIDTVIAIVLRCKFRIFDYHISSR